MTFGHRLYDGVDQTGEKVTSTRRGSTPGRRLVELRLDDASDYEVGQQLTADLLRRRVSSSTP